MSKKLSSKTGAGRPPKIAKKTERIHIVLEPDKKKRYQEAAELSGVDLSEWIRVACESLWLQGSKRDCIDVDNIDVGKLFLKDEFQRLLREAIVRELQR